MAFAMCASYQVSRAATIEKTGYVIGSADAYELPVYAIEADMEFLIVKSYTDVTNLPSLATLVAPFDLSLYGAKAVTEPIKRTYGYTFIRLFHWRCQKK